MEKNLKIWGGAIIAIVIAIILFFVIKNNPVINQVTTNSESGQSATESSPDINNQNTDAAATSISYANALIKYADRRIQLDDACQARPNSVTYKDNTGIMIDNRSAYTRTVKVGTTFTIRPWGFKIVVLPDTYLKSKTVLIDCNQYQNVATILIQE